MYSPTIHNEGSRTQHFLQCVPNHPMRITLITIGVLAIAAAFPIGLAHTNAITSFSLGGAGLALIAGVALKAYFFPRDVVILGGSDMDRPVWKKMGVRVMLRYKSFHLQTKPIDYDSMAAAKQRVVLVYTQTIQSDANFLSGDTRPKRIIRECNTRNIPWCIYIKFGNDKWDKVKTSFWDGQPYILGANSKLPFTRNSAILTQFFKQPNA